MTNSNYHESVMNREVIEKLHISNRLYLKNQAKPALTYASRGRYIDATVGTAGHTLEMVQMGGEVLGIEADPEMLTIANERLKEAKIKNCKLVIGNFVDIDIIAKENGFTQVSGILFDLGVSNLHLKDLSRGFSFENPEAELDMRLNKEGQGVKALDLLNLLRHDQLIDLFTQTLDLSAARWLSSRVISAREEKKFETVEDLLEICKGLKTGKKKLHEATLPFLALRIAVNTELDNFKNALPKAFELLEEGGKLIILTFHSKEEEIVNEFFGKKGETLTPSDEEVGRNQRARSAKMRVLEKINKNVKK